MYERSAIVLEKYIEETLKLNKTNSLKKNTENYRDLIDEIYNFQITINKDIKVIQEFDNTIKEIEGIQKEQDRLYKINKRLEDDRTQLFNEIGEDYKVLESKLKKIENTLEKNNSRIKELREEYIKNLENFLHRQKERNRCDKERRLSETRIIKIREEMLDAFNQIDIKDISNLKDFISSEKEKVRQQALEIMTKNGKNEKVPFNQDVLRKAINNRIDIAEKEAECYILVYDKMKKLLAETDTESISLDKYKKVLRDITVKLAFLNAQKEYIVSFLDYERMTAISGAKAHKKAMQEACNNFELDIMQIKNLYTLILKEIANKATQKAYNELYNKNYLRNIEDKEKNFEKEVNNVNIKSGTLINSNYWRIEGIKNIYNTFNQQVTEQFEKDLSEYEVEEIDDIEEYLNIDSEDDDEEDKQYKNEYEEENEDDYEDDDEEQYEDDYEDDSEEQYEDDYDYEDDNEEQYEDDYDYEDDDEEQYEDDYEDDSKEEYEDDDQDYEEHYENDGENYEKNNYEEDDDGIGMEDIDIDDLDKIIKNSRKANNRKSNKLNKGKKSNKTKNKSSEKGKEINEKNNESKKPKQNNAAKKSKKEVRVVSKGKNEKAQKGLFNKLFKKD